MKRKQQSMINSDCGIFKSGNFLSIYFNFSILFFPTINKSYAFPYKSRYSSLLHPTQIAIKKIAAGKNVRYNEEKSE